VILHSGSEFTYPIVTQIQKVDIEIFDKLTKEMSGILNWAIKAICG